MPKPVRIKYGPSAYVFMNNREWGKERTQNTPSHEKQKIDNSTSDFAEHEPSIKQVDLYHLSQQSFAQSIDALKRWFLTALVLEEDVYLLNPPNSPEEGASIQQHISAINNILNKKADDVTQNDFFDLKTKLCDLVKKSQWIGVGLEMVDNKNISIDVLNSLLLWQASIIQFGENAFKLYKISEETPLKSLKNSYTFSNPHASLHQDIFAEVALTLSKIRETEWGKIYEQEMHQSENHPPNWQPSIKDFHSSLVYYQWCDENTGLLYSHFPSTTLHERVLIHNKQWAIPVFAFGYLYYEDFNAAAYLSARLMQAYLPGAKGNLYRAHREYLGQALVTLHDLFHTSLPVYNNLDLLTIVKKMKLSSIIGNAYVQKKEVNLANSIVDNSDGSILCNVFSQSAFLRQPLEQMKDFFMIIYTEFAWAAGISAEEVSYTKQSENEFTMHVVLKSQTVALPLALKSNDWVTPFYNHFEELKKLPKGALLMARYTPANGSPQQKTVSSNKDKSDRCSIM